MVEVKEKKPRGRPKKQPGADLEPTLKASLEGMSDVDLRKKVSEVALYRNVRIEAMKADPVIAEARKNLNEAAADYKLEIKGADAQIQFASHLLDSRGKL